MSRRRIVTMGAAATAGAKGDGVTIDSDAVNRAIDEAASAVPPGGRGPGGTVNSPNADAIALKSSYALGEPRATENVAIDNCLVSGYDLGTLHDSGFKTAAAYGGTGRVKFGTESNGGFKNIAISNVIFEHISSVIAYDADPGYPSTISGIPGHAVEDVRISGVRHELAGGLTTGEVDQNPSENEGAYSETTMFGPLPAYGFFIRHVKGIVLDNVEVRFEKRDTRPAYALRDVTDADFHHNRADKVQGAPTFVVDQVDDFTVTASRPVPDTRLDHATHTEL